MTDLELLQAAEAVLADAIHQAEFTQLPKDVAYCNFVGARVEALRAKIHGTPPYTVQYTLLGSRMMKEVSCFTFRSLCTGGGRV